MAVEEPLEIRLHYRRGKVKVSRSLAVTMRTPGHDEELAAGFLASEGIVRRRDEIARIFVEDSPEDSSNVVVVELAEGVRVDPKQHERNFVMNSGCGVCGKTSLKAMDAAPGSRPVFFDDGPRFSAEVINTLAGRMHAGQTAFHATGGLHAAGLFDTSGELLALREDIGRHNAVDKVLGSQWLAGRSLAHHLLFVSGRAGFELIQKAVAHGVPFLAAVGAPTSLAVEFASRFNATLVGFVRDGRFNIYTGSHRIAG